MTQASVLQTSQGAPSSTPDDASPSPAQVREAFLAGPQRWLDVGHSELAYWRFGAGPDLVCVHGWPVHAATFRAQLPQLARHFTCHLIDLPGAGCTEAGPDAPIEIGAHSETIGRVVSVLGLSRYALLAHDSGAVAARLHAAGNPRVSALVFSGSEIPRHRPRLLQAYMALSHVPGGAQMLIQGMRLAALRRSRLALGSCFVDPGPLDEEFVQWFLAPLIRSRRAAAQCVQLLRTLRFAVVDDLVAAHARITAPTLMIWGEHDPYFPVDKARAMVQQFAGPTRFESVSSASLFVHEERPATYAQLTVDFLCGVSA